VAGGIVLFVVDSAALVIGGDPHLLGYTVALTHAA
jgi:hypothetical protein